MSFINALQLLTGPPNVTNMRDLLTDVQQQLNNSWSLMCKQTDYLTYKCPFKIQGLICQA